MLAYCRGVFATHKKKRRQTCWSFLLILLTLVALVELGEGLRSLLQARHQQLNVVQGTVKDLLPEEGRERERERPLPQFVTGLIVISYLSTAPLVLCSISFVSLLIDVCFPITLF